MVGDGKDWGQRHSDKSGSGKAENQDPKEDPMQKDKYRNKEKEKFPCLVAEQEHPAQRAKRSQKGQAQQRGFTNSPPVSPGLPFIERKRQKRDTVRNEVDYQQKHPVFDPHHLVFILRTGPADLRILSSCPWIVSVSPGPFFVCRNRRFRSRTPAMTVINTGRGSYTKIFLKRQDPLNGIFAWLAGTHNAHG